MSTHDRDKAGKPGRRQSVLFSNVEEAGAVLKHHQGGDADDPDLRREALLYLSEPEPGNPDALNKNNTIVFPVDALEEESVCSDIIESLESYAMLGAAALVSHPAESLREELADIVDAVVIEPIDHRFDHRAGFVGFRHVGVAGQHRLFGARSFHATSSAMNSAARQPIIIDGALVLAEVTAGMTLASAAQSPRVPATPRRGVTGPPIARVPTGW